MIHVSLITPEKVQYQADADSVSLPTSMGQIQVLNNHVPLVAILAPGEVKIHTGGETIVLAVSQGYIEVRPGNQVVILANTAEHASEIDVDRAEAAKARARDLFKGKVMSDEEYATVMGALEKEFTRVRIGRKHVSHRRPVTGQ